MGVSVNAGNDNQLPKKSLLHFAHRGEAQIFLEEFDVQPVSFPVKGAYEGSDCFLLISGEGRQNATESLAAFLGFTLGRVSEVVNIGVAGDLSGSLDIGDVVSVRTVYGEAVANVAFRTFTSADNEATVDCISARDRVLSDEAADRLSCFAPLVDREAWACGSVAQRFRIPFRSLKLISDTAGDLTKCAEIAASAADYSLALFQSFTRKQRQTVAPEEAPVTLPEGFYATVAQKRQLNSLLKSVAIKQGVTSEKAIETFDLDAIREAEAHPKKRTTILIQQLRDFLNPFRRRFEESLWPLVEPLREGGIKIVPARDYENTALLISFSVEDGAQLTERCRILQRFNYPAYQRLLDEGPELAEAKEDGGKDQ